MASKLRLMITGGNGFVAGSVLAQAGVAWEIHVLSRSPALIHKPNLHWHRSDPLDADARTRLFRSVKPDRVLHTAAVADIDFCQANPEIARSVNVDFTRALVDLCAEGDSRLVFCSTDTVFDGEHAPYREDDLPDPVNFYAETKVEAERLVLGLGATSVVVRLALVVGLPVLGTGNSFLVRMLDSLRQGRQVRLSMTETRTPIDVITLGRALLELASSDTHGILHLAGATRISRFAMARRIADRFALPQHLVVPAEANPAPGRAPRPRDVSLDVSRARAELKTPVLDLDQGLSLILSRTGGESNRAGLGNGSRCALPTTT